jgi:hypothetical protein
MSPRCAAAIDVLRETGATTERLIALIEGHSACIDRCRPRAHAPRSLAQGDAWLAMQRPDEHHGIVMNWTAAVSNKLSEVGLSWSIAVIIEGMAPQKLWE